MVEKKVIPPSVSGYLEIDLAAITDNYHALQSKLGSVACGAVVKADGYGFGAAQVSQKLAQKGCTYFFVAHLEEGLALRQVLPDSKIYVFSGLFPGTAKAFIDAQLIPVINNYVTLEEWLSYASVLNQSMPLVLHIDTGMSRIGMDRDDVKKMIENWPNFSCANIHFLMSHLACSENLSHPMNLQQLEQFQKIKEIFPRLKGSLASTEGIFLGSNYHFDIVRAGKGLFGLYQSPDSTVVLKSCLTLKGRVVQIRTAFKGEFVGYGATCTLTRDSRLAVVGIGFADGYFRGLSNKGYMLIEGYTVPVLGRISMDYTVVDVTDIPESLLYRGMWADVFNSTLTLDESAKAIGTISREISTHFGQRLFRVYKDDEK